MVSCSVWKVNMIHKFVASINQISSKYNNYLICINIVLDMSSSHISSPYITPALWRKNQYICLKYIVKLLYSILKGNVEITVFKKRCNNELFFMAQLVRLS